MQKNHSIHLCRLILGLTVMLLFLPAACPLEAQTTLENPQPASFQSGLGMVSGWACSAQRIDIVFDGLPAVQAAYGTSRVVDRTL
jgi:hypothetical protein